MNVQGDQTIAATQPTSILPRSGSAIAALVLGIAGLALYPLGILSLLAMTFALNAHFQIRAGRARGRGMVIAGTVLGALGILASVIMWAYVASTFVSRLELPTPSVSSPKVAAEGVRFLKNRATILGEFVHEASGDSSAKGRVTTLSSTTGGRTDSIDIYASEGMQTGPGFKTGIDTTPDAGAKQVSGNLLLVSKDPLTPPLPIAARIFPSLPMAAFAPEIAMAHSAYSDQLVYGTADPPGGRLIVEGDHVTLLDSRGKTLGRYDFAGIDALRLIREVSARQVPAPDPKIAAEKCRQAIAIHNAHVFAAQWDTQAEIKGKDQRTSKSELIRLSAQKVTSYDCATRRLSAHFSVDFTGEANGRGFQGLVFAPLAPSYADMAAIESRMKENYASTGRQLTTLRCARKGRVSYKDSPIECDATDSKDNSVSALVMISVDGSNTWTWGRVTPPNPNMADIEQAMKKDYLDRYGRPLSKLHCERKGRVSQKESPIGCDATDSAGDRLKFVITVGKDTGYRWTWSKIAPEVEAPPKVKQPQRKATEFIDIECPAGSEIVENNRAGVSSGAGICSYGPDRHFCPDYTEPVYWPEGDVAYCYNPRNEAGAPKDDPASAWLAPGYGPQSFPR